ncbi:MAG: class A beta-lactamase [Proteobacteria bacterium]|nr:class A beta-lactamase [Pseudomonadota bacterium]
MAAPAPALAADDLLQAFDSTFGPATPHQLVPARPAPAQALAQPFAGTLNTPRAPFEAQLAALAEASHGRIGVAAYDFATGRSVGVRGDQPFPLASTAKVAIVATFLEGVDQGRWHLTDRFPLIVPLPSRKFEGTVAPVRQGEMMSALDLIELAITRSDNHATDALLAAIGGPQAVDRWLAKAGVQGMRLDHDIATMVRDDGAVNPATTIDPRDSTTPLAMTRLLAGLYRGEWLSAASRDVLLGAMSRCRTGTHRIRALLPETAMIGHKTGTLSNTSSDVGIFRTVDGHPVAVAIYVTGQGTHAGRDSRIASIARAIFDDYHPESQAFSPNGTR